MLMCTQAYEYFIRLVVYVYEGKDIVWNTMSDVQHEDDTSSSCLIVWTGRKSPGYSRTLVRDWSEEDVSEGLCDEGSEALLDTHRRGRTHQLKHTQTCFRQCPSCFI